jgi:DNA-binding HxlR family transcriptional regulator
MEAVQHVFELDRVLHERCRLAIVSVLATSETRTFAELKQLLNITDGNLSVHLRNLESAAYVTITKRFVGRRPQTSCTLTKAGKDAFQRYLAHLEAIVLQNKSA